MTRIFYAAVLLVFFCLPAMSFAQKPGAGGPAGVFVATVTKGEFADQVEALGTTKANETVIITADRAEKIAAIHFEDGQMVKEGDLLVTLDKGQEEAELRAAEALMAETENAYKRAQGLSGNSALPKATLQERASELKKAQADVEAIKARLESYEITAPFDGILGLREVSVGTLIQPGDMITTIDDLSRIKVDFDVPSIFLATLKPGLPVTGHIEAFGERAFKGTVSTVNTQVDPVTRSVRVRAILPNEDGLLKPGLLMQIELNKNPRQALLIPEEALLKRGENNFVFKVAEENGKAVARQTQITLGARRTGTIEVLSGLETGDKIVTHGTVKLRDGAPVTISAEEKNSEPLSDLLQQKQAGKEQ